MKKMRPLFILLLSVCCLQTYAQSPNWKVIESEYETDDVGVMTYNVKDAPFNAKGDGVTNDQPAIRNAIAKAKADGGGVVFIPKGMYKMNNIITIPSGVTVRGEWKKPVKGQPIEGTILMAANVSRGYDRNRDASSFITMQSSTSLTNIAIWYPDQKPGNIVAYPPTIMYGQDGQWGNDYCNVRNVTLVNSYNGVCLSRTNGGGCPNIYGLYGTALSVGVEIDNIADVGRFEWIDLSPDYWAGSGLADAPALDGAHKSHIYNNATGIVMRRNDWSYTCYVNVEGYKTGFSTLTSPSGVPTAGSPNGHNYKMTFKNCKTAVYSESSAGAGLMFSGVNVDNCENGLVVGSGEGSIVQLIDWNINASKNAVQVENNASKKVMMQQCTVANGKVIALGGVLMPTNCDFNNSAPQITIGSGARAIITGNRFAQGVDIVNNSMFKCAIDHTPVAAPALPAFAEFKTKVAKPAKNDLYVVTKAPYFAYGDGDTDNTAIIQQALNDAGANGGGIVYIPAGHFKVLGNLTVPTGVELKGTNDFGSVPKGPGSVLEVYAGKGDPTAQPFLKLSQGSGVRGIVFNYPEQMWTLYPNWYDYPYCIQATGSDVYIMNIGLRAVMHGVDLFTYKCDNHYVDYLAGHVFETGIKVGGGSENGIVCNTQFNTLVYSNGRESKFGTWPNSPDNNSATTPTEEYNKAKDACYNYNWDKLDFLTLGNCKNETLYNIFHYGSQRGLIFGDESGSPTGISMGTAIDASRKAVTYRSLGAGGFDMINSQIVSTTGSNTTEPTTFIETAAGFTGTARLFNSDYWGGTNRAITANGGNLELYQAHFNASGRIQFGLIANNGFIKLLNSDAVAISTLLTTNKESQAWIQSSVLNYANTDTTKYNSWKNNLSVSPVFATTATLPRTGWIASSFNSNAHNNAIDGNITTRWSTVGAQAAGQWFAVNTKAPVKFNKIILDSSPSSNDGPAGYAVYLSSNGTDWGEPVATGIGASVTIISIPETTSQYVRVLQTTTGVKSGYWSIHEFYLAYVEGEETAVRPDYAQNNHQVFVADGTLYLEGFASEPVQLNVYSISGQKVLSAASTTPAVDVSSLPSGVYIVDIKQGGEVYRAKALKK
ncbi:glycosyl hydrolase family 28-related protein [Viscerimonas tarda]